MAQQERAKPATESPNLKEIHWLAGFLEGEGAFGSRNRGQSIKVQVSSTDYEPLQKCLRFFGGRVYGPYKHNKERWSDYWQWITHGPRATGIMMTVLPLLSPRRQEQIDQALKSLKL